MSQTVKDNKKGKKIQCHLKKKSLIFRTCENTQEIIKICANMLFLLVSSK